MQFSRAAEKARSGTPTNGLSKLNSMRPGVPPEGGVESAWPSPVDVLAVRPEVVTLGGRRPRGADDRESTTPCRTCPNSMGLPRKEVIQPQLPLRLPCYDFTPVTGPTFDGSLPEGLGHRLRVLPTPVV
jgi:hypothetical protein